MAGRGPDHPVDRGRLVAAIIAGGRAVRLGGRVKALIEIDGETILDRQRALLAPRVDAIVISANDAAPFADTGLEVVADRAEGGGPMLGIAAALEATGADWLLALGSDMPNVSGAVLDLLFARARAGVDVVAPWVGGHPEPLLALYAGSALAVLRAELAAGRRSLTGLLSSDALAVAAVDEAALRAVDPALACLVNINRPSDLVRLTGGER